MDIRKIILCTDFEGLEEELKESLEKTGISIGNQAGPLENPKNFHPEPACLYVFAYSECCEKMQQLVALQVKHSLNILAVFPRPSSGITSQDELLQNVTFFSPERIISGILQKTHEILEVFECEPH